MKNALVFTYYNVSNYGAFLQAFALQKYLESVGIESDIYPHDATDRVTFVAKILQIRKKKKTQEEQDYKISMSTKVADCQKKLNISNGKNSYDISILGSDEIWNVKNLSAVHYPFFFRGNRKTKKTISYAACSGKTQKKHLRLFPYAIPGIQHLDAVSVRDDSTEKLVKSLGITNPVRVLDPTFLIKLCDLEEVKQKKCKYDNYIFVYTYGLDQREIDNICAFANSKELKVVATGSYCPWADENPIPDPFEWISMIKNCTYMFTSTFHGAALAIQCNCQFAFIGGGSAKVISLLNEFRLMDRMASSVKPVDAILSNKIDYDVINTTLNIRAIDSKNFLHRAFGLEQLPYPACDVTLRGGGVCS